MTHTALLITPTRRFVAVIPINPINLAILLCIWPQPKDTFIASISWLNLASTFLRWTSIDTRPKTWRPYTIGTTFCATWTRPPLSWSSPISRKNEFCLFNFFLYQILFTLSEKNANRTKNGQKRTVRNASRSSISVRPNWMLRWRWTTIVRCHIDRRQHFCPIGSNACGRAVRAALSQ